MSVSIDVGPHQPQHDPAIEQMEAQRRAQIAGLHAFYQQQQEQQLLLQQQQQQKAAPYQQQLQQQQQQYGAPRTESVTLPVGAFPGKEYTFTTHDGRGVTFAVPRGLGPGSVVQVYC